MKLTETQVEALKALAAEYGMCYGSYRGQFWIGYAGAVGKNVVYSAARLPGYRWEVRGESDKPLARRMRGIMEV